MTKQNDLSTSYLEEAKAALIDANNVPERELVVHYMTLAQLYALLSIAEAVQALKGGEKPEPVDDTKPIPCPDCGEVPELAHLVRKVWSCTCHCSLGSAGRGHTEAQAIARWNAAARVK